ncbi:hypothetical protein BNJ_00063 [Kaumoebavirus]|nr:hypothetical protein BNJ_00063 [Kaumoebavirus]ARA71905.1 hypothetical protein BNJ_00063 [Kaumoebavirus]
MGVYTLVFNLQGFIKQGGQLIHGCGHSYAENYFEAMAKVIAELASKLE